MKKTFPVLFLSFCMFNLYGQNFGSSIPYLVTGGLFTNELDAALNPYWVAAGPDFSDLKHDYFFGGFENGYTTGAGTSEPKALFGYFRAGERPWSAAIRLEHAGPTNQTIYEDDGTTSTEYNQPLITIAYDYGQFLMNFGNITAGVNGAFIYNDGSPLADNYTETGPGVDNQKTHKDIDSTLSFSFPIFVNQGKIHHYIAPGASFTTTDDSESESGVNNFDITDTSFRYNLSLAYRLGVPFLTGIDPENELRIASWAGIGFTRSEYENKNDDTNITETREAEWDNDYRFGLSIDQFLYLPAPSWIEIGIQPGFYFSYRMSQVYPRTLTVKTTALPDEVTEYDENQDVEIYAKMDCAFGAQLKPKDWIIGLMLGATPQISFLSMHQYRDYEYGVYTGSPNSVQTRYNSWSTSIQHSYGLFVPLPDGYRFDIRSNYNLLEFHNLQIQLNIPIDWKRKRT